MLCSICEKEYKLFIYHVIVFWLIELDFVIEYLSTFEILLPERVWDIYHCIPFEVLVDVLHAAAIHRVLALTPDFRSLISSIALHFFEDFDDHSNIRGNE